MAKNYQNHVDKELNPELDPAFSWFSCLTFAPDNHLIFSLTSALASFLFLCAQFLDPRLIYSVDHYELEYFLGGNILWIISHFGLTCCCKTLSFLKLFILKVFLQPTNVAHQFLCAAFGSCLQSIQSVLRGFLTGGQQKCCHCCLGQGALSRCSGAMHWGPESHKPQKLWQQLKVWLVLSPCQIQWLSAGSVSCAWSLSPPSVVPESMQPVWAELTCCEPHCCQQLNFCLWSNRPFCFHTSCRKEGTRQRSRRSRRASSIIWLHPSANIWFRLKWFCFTHYDYL